MLNRQQQAQKLRDVLVPYIESSGVEQEVECRDGTTRRYRGARVGSFVLYYETPSHQNPRPVPSCWDEAVYMQANPIEDYSLTVKCFDSPDDLAKGKQMTMFSACWRSKGDTIHISSFANNGSRWCDNLFAALDAAVNAARPLAALTSGPEET
jgi:hypothetical protein